MTCPVEMIPLVDALKDNDLWATHTRAPPRQIVVTSRDPAKKRKVTDGLLKLLQDTGHIGRLSMTINDIRGQRDWQSWSVSLEEGLEKTLLEKGRYVVGLQTFYIRIYLTVPQCRRCLRYGHENCDGKPSCFRCGSEEHQARDCKEENNYCIPCIKEGLDHRHKGPRYCNSYQLHLEHLKMKLNTGRTTKRIVPKRARNEPRPEIVDKQTTPATPMQEEIQVLPGSQENAEPVPTPKPRRSLNKRVLLVDDVVAKEQSEEQPANSHGTPA